MADAAIGFLLENLREQLRPDHTISKTEKELKGLEDGLSKLRAFLRDGVMKLPHNSISQGNRSGELDLERQVKDVVDDVEDNQKLWLIYTATKRNNFISRRLPLDEVGLKLAREFKSIRSCRLEPLQSRIQAYHDLQVVEEQPAKWNNKVPSVQLNKEVPPVRVNNIVGFEDEADILINYLMEEMGELDVVSITGMPGIGKTTLAWNIFQNERILTKFPTRIWVDIPLDFCMKDLYLNILKELIFHGMIGYQLFNLDIPEEFFSNTFLDILNDNIESGRIDDRDLINAVRGCLENREVLLVMDSVWTADSLRSAMDLMPRMGKVLITTRDKSVCVDANVTRKPHMLRFLDEKESWDLLQLELFGKLNECPETLKSTGICIANNCGGLPLAIVVAGSSLVVKSSTLAAKYLMENWWKKVSQNVIVQVTDYSQHRLFSSVELSYIKLPQCLQNCFLYLGVFLEGEAIPVWTLTRLWIAEGLIQDNQSLTLDETAENNLYDLIDRNLVMVDKSYPNGLIKTCRLHKMMYEFCKYKAAEQDFYQEIRMSQGGSLDHPNNRRLCIYSHLSRFLCSGPKALSVRSILCFSKEDKVLQLEHRSTIHRSFKLLKILECRCINFSKFPTKLTELMLLRYISLSCDALKVIPKAITSLCYLETLVVDTKSPSVKLEANIWRMLKLQHLVTKAAIVVAIRGTGEAGENLQTLTRLAPEWCTDDVLGRAPNLKTLGILGHLAALSSPESLRKLELLENLKLRHESAAADRQWQDRLIASNCFPPNLKRLTLSATNLDWERMSVLGKIASLEILKLKNNAFKGESWIHTDAGGFPRLGFLLIGTTDLVSWEPSADCFPSLKCLVLKNCERLHKIPATLAKSLDCLEVENISESAVESAKEIEQQQNRRLHEFKLSIRHGSE